MPKPKAEALALHIFDIKRLPANDFLYTEGNYIIKHSYKMVIIRIEIAQY